VLVLRVREPSEKRTLAKFECQAKEIPADVLDRRGPERGHALSPQHA